jgi:tetratricopeptide (TPR) repeat protein
MSGELQFAAFLSYSRKDVRLASWLARSLEEFRPPRQTVEELKARRAPFVAARPIFRDQQDMPVGGVISDRLSEVLDASATVIVLCTTSSAKSDWVNREIELFASRHPDRRIIPVVAEGHPDRDEIYPRALLKFGKPLAADLRDPRERRQTVVKIAAAVLDLDVDHLVGRVKKHRAKQLRWLVAGTGTAAVVLVGLVVTAGVMTRSAQLANDRSFGTVNQALTTARANVNDLAAKKALHELANQYFESMAGTRLSDRDLLLKAEWLRQEGKDAGLRHEDSQSLAFRKEAHAATTELLRRDPANPDFLLSHALSAYWMGNYYFLLPQPQFEAARPFLQEYADVAERLLHVAPDYVNAALSTDARSEVYYAQVNLGLLALEQNRDPRAAAEAFSNALRSLKPHPESLSAKLDLSRAHMQYIAVLAQFAAAAEVMEAVRAWAPLLLELETHRGDSDVEFHLANSWGLIQQFENHLSRGLRSTANVPASMNLISQRPTRDPDNATSLSLAAELDLDDAQVKCEGLPQPASVDVTSKPEIGLIARCLKRMPTSEQLARCSTFAAALPGKPGLLDQETSWATLLSACSRSAHRAGDSSLSKTLEQIGATQFFAREPEQTRLQTQFALASFATRESNDWISSLNTSLEHRGWTTIKEK